MLTTQSRKYVTPKPKAKSISREAAKAAKKIFWPWF